MDVCTLGAKAAGNEISQQGRSVGEQGQAVADIDK
jgi:hypothetical protein